MCAKKRVQNIFHHISITFLWQWDDSKREENELFWKIGTSICIWFFFLTLHFHHIFMTFFQNSFPYHCDENVMEQSSSNYLQKLSHHIFITYLWQWDDAERSYFHWYTLFKINLLALETSSKSDKKSDENVITHFWIFSTWWLFHLIFITMVWKWVLKNILECMILSNCYKNVMDMWCQEKNKMLIEISIFQNNLIFFYWTPTHK